MLKNHKPALLLLATAMIWGGTFIIVKQSLTILHPLEIIAYRFTLAFLFLVLLYWRQVRRNWRATLRPGIGLGLILTVAFVTQTIGLKYTSPSLSALLTGLNAVLVALLEAIVYRKRLSRFAIGGVLTATLGLALLTWPAGEIHLETGLIFTLAAALFFAWHIVATGQTVIHHNPQTLTVIQFAFVALISWCFIPAGSFPWQYTLKTWSALLYLSIPATGIAFFCQSLAQRQLPPVQTALILACEPAFATVFSLLFGYEPLTLKLIVGGFFVLTGIVLSSCGESLKPEAGKMIA